MGQEKQYDKLLSIRDLSVYYLTHDMGTCKAVDHLSLDIAEGETLGLVGETGAGKTTVALSILGLLQSPPGKVMNGEILYKGKDLLKASTHEMRKIRGSEISMVFQDPMTALNPIDRIGDQIAEVVYLHQNVSKAEALKRAGDMLEMVGITRDRLMEYPHQLSGGMKQRVVIAMALACSPKLLIADEPTTALDVTIQAQVLEMMNELKDSIHTSVLMITHDLGIVAEMCQRVAVIYAGEIVETGSVEKVFRNPLHPYTIGLFESLPGYDQNSRRLKPIPGMMPDPSNLPEYCRFQERCGCSSEQCKAGCPELIEAEPGHWVRCFHPQGKK